MAVTFQKTKQDAEKNSSQVCHSGMRSIISRGLDLIGDCYESPLLIMDTDIVKLKYKEFVDAMPDIQPHYAVKANPNPNLLATLHNLSSSFEVASLHEINLLDRLGFLTQDTHFSNPIKSEKSIGFAAKKGINWFTFDSAEELRKIKNIKPDAKLSLRIDVPNEGSDWPLSSKFGAKQHEVGTLIKLAKEVKADVCGLTFHVGSQCRNPENWAVAIKISQAIMTKMKDAGLKIEILNIGGGFPVELSTPVPSINQIGKVIASSLLVLPKNIKVIAEPGRFLVAEAGCLIAQVINTARRDSGRWVYLDVGMFGGLLEISQGLPYVMYAESSGDLVPWTIAGPTCDAIDVLPRQQLLPENIKTGDFVHILNAGAYTSVYASHFNGFPPPLLKFL